MSKDYLIRFEVGKNGRGTISAAIRKDLNIQEGDILFLALVQKIRAVDYYKEKEMFEYKLVKINGEKEDED